MTVQENWYGNQTFLFGYVMFCGVAICVQHLVFSGFSTCVYIDKLDSRMLTAIREC